MNITIQKELHDHRNHFAPILRVVMVMVEPRGFLSDKKALTKGILRKDGSNYVITCRVIDLETGSKRVRTRKGQPSA